MKQKHAKKLLIVMVVALLLPLASICIPEKTTVNAISQQSVHETLQKTKTTKKDDPKGDNPDSTTEAEKKSANNNFSVSMDEKGNLKTTFDNTKKDQDFWNWLYDKGHYVIAGITGVLAIVALGFFIFSISKFQASSINGLANARQASIVGMTVSGIGTALLGSASVIFSLFWNFLK